LKDLGKRVVERRKERTELARASKWWLRRKDRRGDRGKKERGTKITQIKKIKNYCKTYGAISEAVPPLLAKTSHQLSPEKESFCLYFKWKRVKLFIWVE
jgi:hypothetical protein